jgi:hypothetical protein
VLYVTLAYRYGLREWQVGLFGLGLCFALMLSLSFYETWERTFGVYGMLAVFGPAGVALYGLLAAFGKASLGAFSCLFFASVVVFGPLFNTATMVITNVARTWAPGAEGTALSYASLLHNAAQAAGCVEINRWSAPSSKNVKPLELGRIEVFSADFWTDRWLASSARSTDEERVSKRSTTRTLKSGGRCVSAQAAGPVLFVWCQTALGWRAPWLAVCKSNLQPDFNVRVFECFDTSSSAVLR